jgi:hypothetical protein
MSSFHQQLEQTRLTQRISVTVLPPAVGAQAALAAPEAPAAPEALEAAEVESWPRSS